VHCWQPQFNPFYSVIASKMQCLSLKGCPSIERILWSQLFSCILAPPCSRRPSLFGLVVDSPGRGVKVGVHYIAPQIFHGQVPPIFIARYWLVTYLLFCKLLLTFSWPLGDLTLYWLLVDLSFWLTWVDFWLTLSWLWVDLSWLLVDFVLTL
jgi:hypothetical protein